MGKATPSTASGTRVRVVLVLIAAAVVAAVALFPELRSLERSGLIELDELGWLGPVVLVALYCLGTVLLLPIFWLDLAAGAHFDFLWGVFWIQLAAGAASVAGFLMGRHVFGGFVRRMIRRRPKLAGLDAAVAGEGWRLVLLTRLSPVFSFSILSLVYGTTRIALLPYVAATFVGILPGTLLYVYAGDIAGDLSGSPDDPAKPPWQWALEVGGFVATVLIVITVTRRAQRLLGRELNASDG